jgi:hypothetical protein
MGLMAIEHRAQLVAGAALLVIAMTPWHRTELTKHEPLTVSLAAADFGGAPVTPGPLTIDIPRVDPAGGLNLFDQWAHPDMRPWPTGMVIRPLPSGDRNSLRRLGVWDSLLSALLAPFRAMSV